jgi:TRAP-type C4-dicarboxylate transport system substrate-binding protein
MENDYMTDFKTLSLVATLALVFSVPEAAAAEATTWNVSLWGKRRAFTENVEKLAELVEQKTNGQFKLNISYGGLSKPRENLDGISIGAYEMAQVCAFYHEGKNPTLTVNELPFTHNVSLARTAEIFSSIYQYPAVAKDMARWNATLLMPTPMPQYNLVGKGAVLKDLTDFEGQRVRGPGGMLDVLGELGATPASVPLEEVRQAMDSGVIDEAAFAPHAHLATNTLNVATWVTTNLNLGTGDCPVVVNTDALDMLPADQRKALLDSVPEALDFYVKHYETETVAAYNKAIAEHHVTTVTFTPDQTATLEQLSAVVRDEWVRKYQGQFDASGLIKYAESLYQAQ